MVDAQARSVALRGAVVLSVFWFLILGGLGLFFPFYALYLSENAGLTGFQVGLVMAMMPAVGMFAQPLWGQVADRSGARARVLGLLSVGAAAGYLAIYQSAGMPELLVATAFLAVCSTSVIPLCVSITLASVQRLGPHAFGLVRVWGTLGFMVSVVGFPLVLDGIQEVQGLEVVPGGPSEPGLEMMLLGAASCLVAAFLVLPFLPRQPAVLVRAQRGDWRRLLRLTPFRRLLAYAFGAYFCLNGSMALFPVFVRSLGGGIEDVSRMWIVMLVLEIPLIAFSGSGLARLGARGLVGVGIAAGALRWVVCGLTSSLAVVYAASILHGITVTGLIIGAPLYVDAAVPQELRSTAQGMLAMVGVSLGGILSYLGSGLLMDHFGPSSAPLVGGVAALLLVATLPRGLPAVTSSPLGAGDEGREVERIPGAAEVSGIPEEVGAK